jgi:hypothetical protein
MIESNERISFGEADETWRKYDLNQMQIRFNDSDTGYKAIVHQGEMVSIVRRGYELLPNEEAVSIADQAADLAGLVPFDEFTGDWFVRMKDHVIYDRAAHRVHALYALNQDYDVNGDKMHIGVGVHNSIDGSLGFGCGIFTFRTACANMVFAGLPGYSQSFDQRRTLEHVYRKHTAGLRSILDDMGNVILRVMERAGDVLLSYRRMADEKVTNELIDRILNSRLSRKTLPDYLTEEDATIPDLSKWQLYNDVTELIWHNQKSGLKTKTFQFKTLHSLIPLKVIAT